MIFTTFFTFIKMLPELFIVGFTYLILTTIGYENTIFLFLTLGIYSVMKRYTANYPLPNQTQPNFPQNEIDTWESY